MGAEELEGLVVLKLEQHSLVGIDSTANQVLAVNDSQNLPEVTAPLVASAIDKNLVEVDGKCASVCKLKEPGVVFDELDFTSVHVILEVRPVDVDSEVLVVPPVQALANLLLEMLLGVMVGWAHESLHLLEKL